MQPLKFKELNKERTDRKPMSICFHFIRVSQHLKLQMMVKPSGTVIMDQWTGTSIPGTAIYELIFQVIQTKLEIYSTG